MWRGKLLCQGRNMMGSSSQCEHMEMESMHGGQGTKHYKYIVCLPKHGVIEIECLKANNCIKGNYFL